MKTDVLCVELETRYKQTANELKPEHKSKMCDESGEKYCVAKPWQELKKVQDENAELIQTLKWTCKEK
jgi:hypothetical protein